MQPENSHNDHEQPKPYEAPHNATAPTDPKPFNSFGSPQEAPVSVTPTPDPIQTASFQPSLPATEPVYTEKPKYAMQTATDTPAPKSPETNVSDLTLYLVVLFSGLSVIASASYLIWTVLTHFMTEPEGYSFFDLSTFNIYILIYLVLFGTLNVLASLRLDKRVKEQGTTAGSLRTVGAIWRALLVVWGVSAIVGILYSPLSASIAGTEGMGSQIAIDVISAVFALALIAGFFWRDVLLHKVRSALIPTMIIAVLVTVVAAVGAFTTLNPKEAPTQISEPMDYSSSFEYNDLDSSSSDSGLDSTSQEFDFSEAQ